MLRIDVMLVPGGDEPRARLLARAELGNVSALAGVSDYRIFVCEGHNDLTGAAMWAAQGTLRGHPRRQSVWTLVERAAAFCAERAKAHER